MNEKRHHKRTDFMNAVELVSDCGRIIKCSSKDISDGGIFVKDLTRKVGDKVVLTYTMGHIPIQLTAKVIRKCIDGVALKFYDEQLLTNEKK